MVGRERRKMKYLFIFAALTLAKPVYCLSIQTTEANTQIDDNLIDFDEDYSVKFNKKYGSVPWNSNDKFNKDTHKYTIIDENNAVRSRNDKSPKDIVEETTPDSADNLGVLPLELISTTENTLLSIIESTTESDLTVIPLSTTKRTEPNFEIRQTVTLPSSTQSAETLTDSYYMTTENDEQTTAVSENIETTTTKREATTNIKEIEDLNKEIALKSQTSIDLVSTTTETVISTTTPKFNVEKTAAKPQESDKTSSKLEIKPVENKNTTSKKHSTKTDIKTMAQNITIDEETKKKTKESNSTIHKNKIDEIKPNSTKPDQESELKDSKEDITPFADLDESQEVPEDYYDAKDVVPTTAPKTDALSVIFGIAGKAVESVVESVAERVVPKGIYDLFKRMQRQSEALEAERLRSREENGGLGQFGRGILKSISTGLSRPLSQLMAGVKDIGSLDSDRGFVSSLASGVTSAANSVADMFKDRVQAIYPGTVWCGDGHSAQARSGSELGLFFFTDTCCKEHDACKIYIRAGDTKYGLTNTGLFTRSHCSCDQKFRDCLRKTNSLVSAQIGLTYFNVLGPQCFRKAHPIVRCVRRTRITGQKCEEYELDYTKPKMWQWFDNETF